MDTPSLSQFTLQPEATLLDAAKAMGANRSRTIVVVEDYKTNKTLGILSEGDILRALISGMDIHSPVRNIMRVSFKYFQDGQVDMMLARKLFIEHGFGLLPVVDAEMHLTAVVTVLDCLRST